MSKSGSSKPSMSNPMSIIRRVTANSGVLTPRYAPHLPRVVNRRAFLRGASSIAIGLPFLESLQSHSAWAQNAQPVFSLWIGGACGVVASDFHPSAAGPLSEATLGKNTKVLAPYASQMIMGRGFKFPGNLSNCGHGQGACQVLTGVPHTGGGNTASSSGPSVDTVIASKLNNGRDPIALYSGLKQGYINERLSFVKAGQVRSAESSPKNAFQRIFEQASEEGFSEAATPDPSTTSAPMTSAPPATTTGTSTMAPVLDDITARRKSVIDMVRDELKTLEGRQGLNAADRERLGTHLASLRKIEDMTSDPGDPVVNPGGPVTTPSVPSASCTADAVNANDFNASGRSGEDQEKIAALHMEIVAFAFACNLNRVATLQIGDGTDASVYSVPSNAQRKWEFHHISHRLQNNGSSGNDATAAVSHSEIDGVRMQTLLQGIQKFDSFGLLDKAFLMWTNHVSDGPSHSFNDLPYIVVGNAGGFLKTGQAIGGSRDGKANALMLTTLMHAAGVQETFGTGGGLIQELLA
jgi:hypothetical protein